MGRKIILIGLICLQHLLPGVAYGQSHIKVTGKVNPASIELRWAPVNPDTWSKCNQGGYSVERFELVQGDSLNPNPRGIVLTRNLKPEPLESWEKYKARPLAMIAAQSLYRNSFSTTINNDPVFRAYEETEKKTLRYSFALMAADRDLTVAHASGLYLKDEGIDPDNRYYYRISCPQSGDTTGIVLDSGQPDQLPPSPAPEAIVQGDQILVRWEKPPLDPYTYYRVERRAVGAPFEQLNDASFTMTSPDQRSLNSMIFVDTSAVAGQTYQYRITGVDLFGEPGIPSDTVTVTISGDRTGAVWIHSHQTLDENLFRIVIRKDGECNGLVVESSQNPDDGYTTLLDSLVCTDSVTVTLSRTSYVRVKMKQPESGTVTSFPYLLPVPDDQPPPVPGTPAGRIDTTGIVNLQWFPVQDEGLRGYRIYRANTPDGPFLQITGRVLKDTLFRDTISLQTLTRDIYYSVEAEDMNFNRSGLSPPLRLERPLMRKNRIPGFSYFEVSGDTVRLTFPVPDDGKRLTILRINPDEGIERYPYEGAKTTRVIWENIVPEPGSYRYVLSALDSGGVTYTSRDTLTLEVLNFDTIPVRIRKRVDRQANTIEFSFNYKTPAQSIRIYRAVEDSPVRLHSTLYENTDTFTDSGIPVNSRVNYRFYFRFEDGGEFISDPIAVRY